MPVRFATRLLAVLSFAATTLGTTFAALAAPRPLPALRVSDNGRFLVTTDGKPFFYLADTGWELFHRLDRKEAITYLDKRAAQGFNVIHAVALPELSLVREPNAYGDYPLRDADPTKPALTPGNDPANPTAYDYWDHVDFIVDAANARGLYVAFLPTWARWVNDEKDRIFDEVKARTYGAWVGKRYAGKGIIWILGGDRSPRGFEDVWRAMANGILDGVTGEANAGAKPANWSKVLMSMHPGAPTTSEFFHAEPWLDFNGAYSGHGRAQNTRSWRLIANDYARTPVKPVIDLEPLYEDHPIEFASRTWGYSSDADARQRAYWAVFAGAAGHAYGHHAVWQFWSPGKERINGPTMPWSVAIDRPGATQMQHLKALIESRPYLSRVPAPELVDDALEGADHVIATRGDGYAFVYTPQGRGARLRLGTLGMRKINATWWNPRTGRGEQQLPITVEDGEGVRRLDAPAEGFGADWVLVLDDATRAFPPPGEKRPDRVAAR